MPFLGEGPLQGYSIRSHVLNTLRFPDLPPFKGARTIIYNLCIERSPQKMSTKIDPNML